MGYNSVRAVCPEWKAQANVNTWAKNHDVTVAFLQYDFKWARYVFITNEEKPHIVTVDNYGWVQRDDNEYFYSNRAEQKPVYPKFDEQAWLEGRSQD